MTATRSANQKKVEITWDRVESAKKYKLKYRRQGRTKWSTITTTDTVVIGRVNRRKHYEIRVRAVCESEKSPFSEIANFRQSMTADYTDEGIEMDPIWIYPNPAKDILSVEFEVEAFDHAKIYLIDGMGRRIKAFEDYETAEEGYLDMDIRDVPPGVYYVQVHTRYGLSRLESVVIMR